MPTPVRRTTTTRTAARPTAARRAAKPERVKIEKAPDTASAAARAFNKSDHRFADLEKFVGAASTGEVSQYFNRLEKAVGASVPASVKQALDKVSKNPSAKQLASVKTELQKIFANDAAGFTAAQAARVPAAGAKPFVPELQVLTGAVTFENNNTKLKTTDGRTFALGRGARLATGNGGLVSDWLLGFLQDKGPMTVRGTFSSDGSTLMVEDFAPGSSSNFVDGRVRSEGAKVLIDTTRGEVEITNADLKAKLSKLQRLGVILPGASKEKNGKQVYAENPDAFYSLGRFNDGNPPGKQTDGYTKTADFAYSVFRQKPVLMKEQPPADRTNHTQRFLALGNFKMSGGEVASFEGTYFTTQLAGALTAVYPTEGDRVAQAIFTTPAGAEPKDAVELDGVGPDFARKA